MNLSHLATVYVKAPVAAKIAGATVDVSSDTVSVAFMRPSVSPVTADYAVGSWDTDTSTTPTTYYARRLVTAGDLAVGAWVMWVKVSHSPELIIVPVGSFTVT